MTNEDLKMFELLQEHLLKSYTKLHEETTKVAIKELRLIIARQASQIQGLLDQIETLTQSVAEFMSTADDDDDDDDDEDEDEDDDGGEGEDDVEDDSEDEDLG